MSRKITEGDANIAIKVVEGDANVTIKVLEVVFEMFKENNICPEQGAVAMMNATMNLFASLAECKGVEDTKPFLLDILHQTIRNIEMSRTPEATTTDC